MADRPRELAAPYKSFMPAAQNRYRILATRGASIVLDQLRPTQEVAVIEDSPSAKAGAIAFAADMNLRRRPPGEVARAVSRAIFVGATAVMFVAWLASSH